MDKKQLKKVGNSKGFIAALDQSGGSTPKALLAYGVTSNDYKNEEEMFQCVHAMRTRIIKSPSFDKRILGVILFEHTMRNKIDGKFTADYCWDEKGIVPFLKIDKGLAEEKNGVQLMKDFPELPNLLVDANRFNIFGTKMRSVIKQANKEGIDAVVAQQFKWAKLILSYDLMPIVEPEVDINCPEKARAEEMLLDAIKNELNKLPDNQQVMLKLTIPTKENFYKDLVNNSKVLRVVALSGGYERERANELLAKNNGMIASFSRALAEGLSAKQSDAQFNEILDKTIEGIYLASIK